jgi:hypothetical protein
VMRSGDDDAQSVNEWLSLREAARLEGISDRQVRRRMYVGRLMSRPRERGRGREIYAKSMTGLAQARWRQELLAAVEAPLQGPQIQANLESKIGSTGGAALQGATAPRQLSLGGQPASDERLKKLPNAEQQKVALERWNAVQPMLSHDWKSVYGYDSKQAYVRARARQLSVSAGTIWRWRAQLVAANGDIFALANDRPGPDRGYGAKLDDPMKTFLRHAWEERKLKRSQCQSELISYLRSKQVGAGASRAQEFPSRSCVSAYINAVPPYGLGGDKNPYRRGPRAVREAAGWIARSYDDLPAGDSWCIGGWEVDAILYDDTKRDVVIQDPRPYVLTVLDERSTCILALCLVPRVSSDDLIDLLKAAVKQYGLPLWLVSGRGGHFREGAVAMGQLGVRHRQPREENPRSNRLQRVHRIYADLARRDLGPSWCGANTKEREMAGIDARVKLHLERYCKHGDIDAPIMSLLQAEAKIRAWQEEINMLPTKAQGCYGLTRLAAFRQFRGEIRKVSEEGILLDFARDMGERTIQTGGIIEVMGVRYVAPELAVNSGETRRCGQPRHDPSILIVHPSDQGGGNIIARRRVGVGANDPDALADAH